MKNLNGKNYIVSIQRATDKRTINPNNDFLKKQLNKILFKKDSTSNERNNKTKKPTLNELNHNIQTHNFTKSNNNSKYIPL